MARAMAGKLQELASSGMAATATIAGLQQVTRWLMKDAPRMDVLGQKLIEEGFRRVGRRPPSSTRALSWALGNVGSDTLLFALVGAGSPSRLFVRGALVGGLTGLAAVFLPPLFGFSSKYTARTLRTGLTTVGMYVAAGLAAAGATRLAQESEAG